VTYAEFMNGHAFLNLFFNNAVDDNGVLKINTSVMTEFSSASPW